MNSTPPTSDTSSADTPLRILLTDPHLKGGGQVRYVVNLARELTGLGHHVTIGCKKDSVLVQMAKDSDCPVWNRFHYRGGLRPLAWGNDLLRVRRFIGSERPDILHANGSQDHWVSAIASRMLGRPACVVRTRHNTYAVSENPANRALNLSWTDYQIAVCAAVFDLRASRPVFDASRMTVIHNGVDPAAFAPDSDLRRRAREEFGYAGQDVVLGIAARLTEAKGHRFLFEAVAGLRAEYPRVRLLVLGQGDLESELKQLAEKLEIASITTFAGFRNDIATCIQAFDVGVQPSIDCEASSFSVMEQMSTGIPIVASDHGGTKEIVRDGIDGFIVPQGRVTPLADALALLVRDAGMRRQMGESSRKRIGDEFTLALLAKRTIDAYRSALAVHASRWTGSQ